MILKNTSHFSHLLRDCNDAALTTTVYYGQLYILCIVITINSAALIRAKKIKNCVRYFHFLIL